MAGMNNQNGTYLDGVDHLQQSINDIITTPIGSRVMNRDYGSSVFDLIDHPGNNANLLKVYSAVVDALLRWEPRLIPVRVQINGGELEKGIFDLSIEGVTTIDVGNVQPGTLVQLIINVGG